MCKATLSNKLENLFALHYIYADGWKRSNDEEDVKLVWPIYQPIRKLKTNIGNLIKNMTKETDIVLTRMMFIYLLFKMKIVTLIIIYVSK